MATVDGITVTEARRIEGFTVVSAAIDGSGNLILTFKNNTTLNAGNVIGAHANAAGGGKVFPFSGVRGERTAVQAVPDSVNRVVDFTAAAVYDTDAYRTSSTVFTVPDTGYYDIQAITPWAGNATGRRSLSIRKNDPSSDASQGVSLNNNTVTPGVSIAFSQSVSILAEPLTQNDYIKILAFQASGGSLDILGSTLAGTRTLVIIKRVG